MTQPRPNPRPQPGQPWPDPHPIPPPNACAGPLYFVQHLARDGHVDNHCVAASRDLMTLAAWDCLGDRYQIVAAETELAPYAVLLGPGMGRAA